MVSALPLNRRVTIYILRKPNNFQTVTFCSNAPASPSLGNEEHVGGHRLLIRVFVPLLRRPVSIPSSQARRYALVQNGIILSFDTMIDTMSGGINHQRKERTRRPGMFNSPPVSMKPPPSA